MILDSEKTFKATNEFILFIFKPKIPRYTDCNVCRLKCYLCLLAQIEVVIGKHLFLRH